MHTIHFTHQILVPVRAEAADSAEMVTQLLFGDLIDVLEEDRQWRRIRNREDGYEGWIDEKMISPVSKEWMDNIVDWQLVAMAYVPVLCMQNGLGFPLHLVRGSRIPVLKKQENPHAWSVDFPDAKLTIRIPRESTMPLFEKNSAEVVRTSEHYLGAPYLWGGRSPWGIDCSGLTQLVFRTHGVQLPRDASQQILEGETISYDQRRPGDLAFFENAKGRVHHVGIVLPGQKIRHASGNVHDDILDAKGILNLNQIRTHHLCAIKRYIN